MRKLYFQVFAASLLLGSATLAAEETPAAPHFREVRTGWVINGCSQCVVGDKVNDGGLQEMIDDNPLSFWHTSWSNATDKEVGHYWVIDRGENAPEICAFGYLPRQNSTGNGFITDYRLFAVDEDPALPYCKGNWSTAEGGHEAFVAWAADKTPLIDDRFDIDRADINTHGEHIVNLPEPTSARYLVFAVDDSSGNSGNMFANCAELYTYLPTTFDDVYLDKRVALYNIGRQGHFGISATEDGTMMPWYNEFGATCVWTFAKTESGKYTFHNELFDVYMPALPTEYNVPSAAITEEADAGTWSVNVTTIDGPVLFSYGPDTHDYMHMAGNGGLVRWTADETASHFNIQVITDEDYAQWIANAEPAIGYQKAADEAALNEAIEAAKADPADLEKQYALTQFEKSEVYLLPDPDKFYTIKFAGGDQKGVSITDTYAPHTDGNSIVRAIKPEDNIVPSLWQFAACEGDDSDLFIITSLNSGKPLRRTIYMQELTTVENNAENVGHYDILNPNHRGNHGVSLVNYIGDNRGDITVAHLEADGSLPSYKAGIQAWTIEEVAEVAVKFTDGYASFNFPFPVFIPEGVSVFTIESSDDNYAFIANFEGATVPANTPVIVASEEGTVNFPIITREVDAQAEAAEGVLMGTNVPATVENAFILKGDYFAPANGTVPANSVYIVSTSESDAIELAVPVKSISLSKTEVTLAEGETAEIEVNFEPADATIQEVTWTSSNKAVATCSKGVIRAGVAGTAKITATCNGLTAECIVKVIIPVQEVTISQTELTLEVGDSKVLTATVTPEDATDKTVTWTSSNETIATVGEDGKVTAVAPGTAVITATCGEKSADCTVVVSEKQEEDLINEILANPAAFEIYDLAGRQVQAPTRGVYVINLNGRARKVTL